MMVETIRRSQGYRGSVIVLVMLLVAGCATVPPASTMPTGVATATVGMSAVTTPPAVLQRATTGPTLAPVTERTTLASTRMPASPVAVPTPVLYTVMAGDTLLGIALRFEVPMAAIQLENALGEETTVRVGEVLQIPASEQWRGASPFWVVHQIAPGETLNGLAARYGLTVRELMAVNSFDNPDLLTVGEEIILPLDVPVETVAQAHHPAPTPSLAAPALPTPPATPTLEPTSAPLPTSTPLPSAAPTGDLATLASEIYRLINEQRAAYGLPPLVWSDTLARAAQRHADDCHARGWCSHVGSDGSSYKERIIREGYDPVRWSECWAWYGTPEMAMTMWMDEAPPDDAHRRTILSTYLTEVGVGVAVANDHSYYFIADFGTPRN